MAHLGEGTIQALLDEEVPPVERAELEHHLATCVACSAELESLRGASATLSQALRLLDEPVATEQARWRFEQRRRRARVGLAGVALRRAALLVVGSAAVLSAAVPGSPVRDWLADSWQRVAATGTRLDAPPPAEPVAVTSAAPEAVPAGVSVRPADGRMRVVIREPAEGVRLRVQLYDGDRVGVWAMGEAAQARFRTAPDRIEVEGAGPGEVRIEIPRRGERLSLEVDDRVYLVAQGDQLRFPGPAADSMGPEILFEVRP